MSTIRIFTCDIPGCDYVQREEVPGKGPRDFGQFVGIILNGIPDPHLCPGHRAAVADFVDNLEGAPPAIDITQEVET